VSQVHLGTQKYSIKSILLLLQNYRYNLIKLFNELFLGLPAAASCGRQYAITNSRKRKKKMKSFSTKNCSVQSLPTDIWRLGGCFWVCYFLLYKRHLINLAASISLKRLVLHHQVAIWLNLACLAFVN